MSINESVVKGKWNEIKGEIQKSWGKLTGDEIDRAQGNLTSLYGTIQQKYGHKQDEVEQKMNEIVSGFSDKVEAKTESLQEKIN